MCRDICKEGMNIYYSGYKLCGSDCVYSADRSMESSALCGLGYIVVSVAAPEGISLARAGLIEDAHMCRQM